jgi:cold shock CspA family protein/ribosome-associated translation inhibitor RaiA
MAATLQIAAPGFELSGSERELIESHAAKLDEFNRRLLACRVTVSVPNRRPQGEAATYNVQIDLTLPGGRLDVRGKPEATLVTAVQRAFEAARRRLQDFGGARRDVRERRKAARGYVSQLFPDAGYGFLRTDDEREIYFDRNAVLDGQFDRLEVGTEVRFSEEAGDHGAQASTVHRAGAT